MTMTFTVDADSVGRRVAASHGLQWLRQGLEMFAAAPLIWVAMALLFMVVAVVLGLIPFASMLFSVAVPILLGGVLIGCDQLRQGRALEVRHLFSGFEQPFLQPLAVVGALYLAGTIVVFIPAAALAVMGMVTTAAVGLMSPRAGLGALLVLAMVIALIAVASVALSMALWFAPALVVFRGDPPLDALKISLRAALRNVPAFLLYIVALVGLGLVTMSPLIAAVLLAARLPTESAPLAFIAVGGTGLFALCGMVVIMPATWAAMYASYRDVFEE
jgi:hypothetical protein